MMEAMTYELCKILRSEFELVHESINQVKQLHTNSSQGGGTSEGRGGRGQGKGGCYSNNQQNDILSQLTLCNKI